MGSKEAILRPCKHHAYAYSTIHYLKDFFCIRTVHLAPVNIVPFNILFGSSTLSAVIHVKQGLAWSGNNKSP